MYTNAVTCSIITLIITFVVVAAILYFAKPEMIMKKNNLGQTVGYDWMKLSGYSLLIAVIISIVMMVVTAFMSPYLKKKYCPGKVSSAIPSYVYKTPASLRGSPEEVDIYTFGAGRRSHRRSYSRRHSRPRMSSGHRKY